MRREGTKKKPLAGVSQRNVSTYYQCMPEDKTIDGAIKAKEVFAEVWVSKSRKLQVRKHGRWKRRVSNRKEKETSFVVSVGNRLELAYVDRRGMGWDAEKPANDRDY